MTIEPKKDAPQIVLLVEDSLGDVRLTLEAFENANKSVKLQVVQDGVSAMSYLRREGKYANTPRPALILLDLNLPKMGGREVLAQIKADDELKSIPIIILTTSVADADIQDCYILQANCYVSKPVGFELFDELVQSINDFWLKNTALLLAPQASGPSACPD
jgi:two-component system, chemotaxis family, response regulator Rcp1